MEDNVFRIITSDKNNPYRLYVNFLEDSLSLTVLQNSSAKKANIGPQDLEKLAEESQKDSEKYYIELQKKLRSGNENIFKLENDIFTINDIKDEKLDLHEEYFKCQLADVDYINCVFNMLDKLNKDKTDMFKKYQTIEKEKDELLKINTEYESKFNDLLEKKKEDDDRLISSFVSALNEKKLSIQYYKERLIALKNGHLNDDVKTNKTKANSSLVDSDTEQSTSEIARTVKKKVKIDDPCTSKQTNSKDTTRS